jgi:holo-[acyl-carrier protein] synthase
MSVLGIGIDLVELDRAALMLERKGDHALERLLTGGERAYPAERADPVPHFAARLAAKEAVYKALALLPGGREIGWQDIEVVRADGGRPTIALHGRAAEVVRDQRLTVHVSLTHSASAAAAVAVAERTAP